MKSAPGLKAQALRWLALRDYSKKEMAARLLRVAREPQVAEAIPALLGWLEDKGFLSDARFAASLARRRMARYGNSRINMELRNHAAEGALSEDAMRELAESEADRARAVWARKFGTPPADLRERARQTRFLQQRGFSMDAIKKALATGEG
ncbi:MAG: RecX family transcriptional regulator [Burkholderiaceae bacterium]|jgi:regulatory protein|nr:RecX family transcriptional regulator [Burkholderiaceae bacterium]